MVYNVVGLMSGSSLDGLDIALVELTEISGKWSFRIQEAQCMSYPGKWAEELKHAAQLSVPDFLRLHTRYGHFLAQQVNQFIEEHQLHHKIHFIASHGHTVWHEPETRTTMQIGDGAALAAQTLLPVISDLRHMDVALSGQGAPIVPIADRLLFGDYDFCLNLGGIANVTINREHPVAFDICPANQLLNHFALQQGQVYDEAGSLARRGKQVDAVLPVLNSHAYYQQSGPKSLANSFTGEQLLPHFSGISGIEDALHTAVQHIALQIAQAVLPYAQPGVAQRMLVTGGGAFNHFLVEQIQAALSRITDISLVLPDEATIQYKEAVAMALIGTLRWREETNVLHSVTGASRSSVGGAMWLPPLS